MFCRVCGPAIDTFPFTFRSDLRMRLEAARDWRFNKVGKHLSVHRLSGNGPQFLVFGAN